MNHSAEVRREMELLREAAHIEPEEVADDLIERLTDTARNPYSAIRDMIGLSALLVEAAAALEAAREDAEAVKRVLAVVEEFEGCTAAGYRYMAANIRTAIDAAREARNG